MNTLKGLSLTALLLAGAVAFIVPTQATTEAPLKALSQAPIEAPVTALTYPSTTITTSPAQPITEAPTQALIEAPAEALILAPAQPLSQAPAQAPTQAPERPTAALGCEEDMPCWACTVNDNRTCVNDAPQAPQIDPYSGNPIVDCTVQGLVRAEDYSCVPATFHSPTPDCKNLQLGDAWAGVGLTCNPPKPSVPVYVLPTACLDALVPVGTPGNYCNTY